ncbi:uncharacterized protein LOC134826666 [Bolinopsis microptera]|uniref:uncharacterized protein LOC134826666 n=1 Tax=Bolinopsis microptera TaxID=2820187 RepID=UPI0030793613
MLFFLIGLLGGCWVAQGENMKDQVDEEIFRQRMKRQIIDGVNVRELYKGTVVHYKDPDFEAGKKSYLDASATDLLKDKNHFRAFKKNAKLVLDHNLESNLEWVATINQFSLETDEEFSHHLGGNLTRPVDEEISSSPRKKRQVDLVVDRSVIEELEARDVDYTPYLPPVKNQGACGSCWAFTATATLEYQVNKDRTVGEEMVALSEQQCVDCARHGNGCGGGWPTSVYTWVHNHYSHFPSTYNYPYEAENSLECRNNDYKNAISGFTIYEVSGEYILTGNDEDLLVAVGNSKIGVISTCIQLASDFTSYSEGVYSSDDCNDGGSGHCVTIVGYGKLNGVPFWRLRNSWGPTWGDGGHINMKRGVNGHSLNMCQVASDAHYPYIEGSDDGQGSGTESEAIRLDCGDGKQLEYRGVINTTISGRDCQRWDSQEPHSHTAKPELHQYKGLEENYCRNPDNDERAWCYTTDSSERWEYCNVPDCSLEKWCELLDFEYSDRLPGSQEYKTKYEDLNSAKSNCYSNPLCTGISTSSDGAFTLMAGDLSFNKGSHVYSKGLCKQFTPPPIGEYCEMDNVKLISKIAMATAITQLEAQQMCDFHEELCVGVSGSDELGYSLHKNKASREDTAQTTWLKGDCPDLTKCGYGDQGDYRGNISVTADGKTCQRWDSQTPHSHDRTPEEYPGYGLEENYCRNPDGDPTAWCYTMDAKRYAECDVPTCDE